MLRPDPKTTEHADKLVQVVVTWLSDRDDKALVAWLIADRLRDYSSRVNQHDRPTATH